jgi:asparagine synthase (glutamine-hydrolysing)
MCGITGFFDFTRKSNEDILNNMTNILYHRGPDDMGCSFYETDYGNLGLGHKRLSILDLSSHGHQPMVFEKLEIVYNGEIYNFKEIKKELEKYNYNFHSDSDTEVILKAYHKWGISSVDKFNGMFAICIYDKVENKLILIRDRTGIKPCYYYEKNDLFMFSSELKSFHKNDFFEKKINLDALVLYLQYGYILQPYTIFEHTYKLRAGHYLELDLKTKKINEKKYWDVFDYYNKPKLDISEDEAINKIEQLLISGFKYRMISDVKVGVFLSGGYDSSIVTAILQSQMEEKLNTFTIGFDNKGFDEAPYAKEIAHYLGTNHTEYYCTKKDALEILPRLCEIYDEPFADSSAIPTVLVSRLASKKVKVSLSADGGDEIFAGYDKYFTILKYNYYSLKLPKSIKIFIKFLLNNINPKYIPMGNKIDNFSMKFNKFKEMLSSTNVVDLMAEASKYFTKEEINILLNNSSNLNTYFNSKVDNHNNDLNQMLAVDYKTYLVDDILTKVDRATMSISLEGREPLLDYRIIEFVAQLPSKIKYKDGTSKYLLKQIAHKYLPKNLLDRPKKGFSVPLNEWFKMELKEYLSLYLQKDRLDKEGIFNSSEVMKLKDEYLNGKEDNIHKLWFILIFQMWYEKWM